MIKYQSIINAFWHGRDVPVPQIQSIRKERWRRSWRSASDLFLCPPPNNLQVWKTAMPFDGMCWRFPSVTGDRPSGCNGNWSVGSVRWAGIRILCPFLPGGKAGGGPSYRHTPVVILQLCLYPVIGERALSYEAGIAAVQFPAARKERATQLLPLSVR